MTHALTVVIPAYNAAASIAGTIDALVTALRHAPSFDAEVVLVDDGSTDDTAATATAAAAGRVAVRIVGQPNRGRFEARRAGLAAARGEWVLLLDSRATLDAGALAFVAERIEAGAEVWNGHVSVESGGSRLGVFWQLLAELAWADYFDDPRTTSFAADDFDRYPKGTTCFLARTRLLREAAESFRSRYGDLRLANDDTPMLRWIAEHERIHISPSFACGYEPRTSLSTFMRHSVRRGAVFLDGHGRRESRFFPAVVAFYPVSAALTTWVLRRPRRVALTAATVATGLAALGVARRRSTFEITTMAIVGPLYAVAHGLGMWKGLYHALVQDRPAS